MANYGYGPPSWSPPQMDLDFRGLPSEYTKWDQFQSLAQQTAADAATNALSKGAVKAIATSVPNNPYWGALHQSMPVIGGLLAAKNLMQGGAELMGLGPMSWSAYSGAKSPQGGLAVLNQMPVDGFVPAEMGTYGNPFPTYAKTGIAEWKRIEPQLEMNTKIQDPAQAKGLAGRRLSPYNKIKAPTSRKLDYGSESSGKPKKAESAYSIKQRKKKKEEEEAFQKMMMNYNQRSQNAIPRLGIVPKTVWDTWVPDSSTSNYATFDDSGRFDGLDLETMIFDLDTIGLLDKPTSEAEALSSALKSMMVPE